VAAMAASGVLMRALPGADARALAPLVHLEAGSAPRWQRRLAVLGGMDLADALRLSRDEARQIDALRDAIGAPDSAATLGYRLGETLATDAILARAAVLESPLPPHWQAEVARGAAATFPVTASDLMPDLSGPALGAALKALEMRWIASGFVLSRTELLAAR
jgi:poly(A) polymerase